MARKTQAIQIAVYDMGSNDLPDKLVRDIESAVTTLVKQHTTVAMTVVTE
jgi:hypothetical protein